MSPAEAKVIHESPAVIEELSWRGTADDSVKGILFSFYNGIVKLTGGGDPPGVPDGLSHLLFRKPLGAVAIFFSCCFCWHWFPRSSSGNSRRTTHPSTGHAQQTARDCPHAPASSAHRLLASHSMRSSQAQRMAAWAARWGDRAVSLSPSPGPAPIVLSRPCWRSDCVRQG